LEGPTKAIAIDIMRKKVSKDFTTTFLKGIGCNWMVCMAVFLCGQASDMTGKYVAIWFPISTFVMIGFEHIPANFYLLEIGLLAGEPDVTFMDVLVKNWIPVTLGNFVAGAFIVAGGYSLFFGRLGYLAMDKFAPKADTQKQTKDQEKQDVFVFDIDDMMAGTPTLGKEDMMAATPTTATGKDGIATPAEPQSPLSPRPPPLSPRTPRGSKVSMDWSRAVSEASLHGV